MSQIYIETSAILTWLFGQSRAEEVRNAVDAADVVMTSTLGFAESERALVRAEIENHLTAGDGRRLRGMLLRAQKSWLRMVVSEDVLTRAGRPFHVEPVRTLDAIHLATALAFTEVFPDLRILSFDLRILDNAEAMGIGS